MQLLRRAECALTIYDIYMLVFMEAFERYRRALHYTVQRIADTFVHVNRNFDPAASFSALTLSLRAYTAKKGVSREAIKMEDLFKVEVTTTAPSIYFNV